MLVVQSRVVIAAIFMTVMVLVTDRKHLSISIRDLKDFALLGIFGVAGSNYTYYMAIQVTSVGIAILMQYTAPAMVAIYVLLEAGKSQQGEGACGFSFSWGQYDHVGSV